MEHKEIQDQIIIGAWNYDKVAGLSISWTEGKRVYRLAQELSRFSSRHHLIHFLEHFVEKIKVFKDEPDIAHDGLDTDDEGS